MDAGERRERASAEAVEWWLELQTGGMSRARREELVDWLRESALHVSALLRIAQVHDALQNFNHWTGISTEGSARDDSVVSFPRAAPSAQAVDSQLERESLSAARRNSVSASRWVRHFTVAASLLAVTIFAAWFWLANGQVISTERGERREVALSDGSVLMVDPETRLRVHLEKQSRQFVLERGRALFRVAKDPRRPFLVQAHETMVRAVGTAFAVERRAQGVTVTVAEGEVAVLSEIPAALPRDAIATVAEQATVEGTAELLRQARAVMLSANEQITVQNSGSAEAVRKVDSSKTLAWAEGRLIFENQTVAQVLADFNRYNRVQLHVADEYLAARQVSGVFNASDPESFIVFIQTVAEVQVVRENGQDITISPR